jgi:putative ABC transport system permease protein
MLALSTSMEQRRRQIAVLRVLGCSAARIVRLVLLEAVSIGLLGAVAGALLSLAGARLVAAAMKERVGLVIDPALSAPIVAGVVLGAVGLAAAAGIVPAVMAYRTSVAKNLKPLG